MGNWQVSIFIEMLSWQGAQGAFGVKDKGARAKYALRFIAMQAHACRCFGSRPQFSLRALPGLVKAWNGNASKLPMQL